MHHIFCDGSCGNNKLYGASASWGFLITDENFSILNTFSGRVSGEKHDSNRAELYSFLKALEYISKDGVNRYQVYVDYEVICKFYNGKVNPKANVDIYDEITKLLNKHKLRGRIQVKKVKAHGSNDTVYSALNNHIDGITNSMSRYNADVFNIKLL